MEKLTIIIPLHEYNDSVAQYLTKALDSVKNLRGNEMSVLSFIGPKSVISEAKKLLKSVKLPQTVNYYENDNTDFFVQVNTAVKYCLTEYFSVLEFDDTYYEYWLENFWKYANAGNEASIYLPIVELYDTEDNFGGFVNEIAWATSFSADEIGYLDLECLKSFMDFNVTGAIINTEDFLAVGGLKPSLRIAAWYEFLMRIANNKKDIFVVPKAGYRHIVGRDGSYMKLSGSEIGVNEGQWLIKKAQEEYEYNEEREIKYNPDEKIEETQTE